MFDERFRQMHRAAFLVLELDVALDELGHLGLPETAQHWMFGRRQPRFRGVLLI